MTVRPGIAATLVLIALLAGAAPAGAQAGPGAPRIADTADPVRAAIEVSRATFAQDGEAEAAVLARPDIFADALAGAALAGRRAPILYPGGESVRDDVMSELSRVVGPPTQAAGACDGRWEVYLLGGTEAVAAGVEQDLVARGYCTLRLAGETRVETAAAIARQVAHVVPANEVLVATAGDWPDAITGGAYAAARLGTPLLVTPSDALHPAVAAVLDELQPDRVVLLGGEAALSVDVEDAAFEHAGSVRRISGPTRAETALDVARRLWPAEIAPRGLTVVNGYAAEAFAYALPAAVLAARNTAPQVLTGVDALPDSVRDHLGAQPYESAVVVGPPSLIGEDVRRTVAERDVPTPALGYGSPIALRGIGPISVGMTVAEAERAGGRALPTVQDLGGGCTYVAPDGLDGLAFMVTDGTIARLDVNLPAYATRSAVRVGDLEDEVTAAYPDRIEREPHAFDEGGSYLVFVPVQQADEDFRLVFETNGERVTYLRTGRLPEAEYIEGCA